MPTSVKFAILVLLSAGMFFAGYFWHGPQVPAVSQASSAKQPLYYACPMHPQYTSDRPGTAPCCGMRLEPVYAASAAAESGRMVQVSAEKQRLIGVRTEQVQRGAASDTLRVPGRVTVDESRMFRVVAPADGWIRQLGQNTTGTFVRKNDILATFYTRELFQAQQSFLFALTNTERQRLEIVNQSPRTGTSLNLRAATDGLRNLGMNDLQIDELQRTQKLVQEVNIYSPADGFVLARGVTPAQRFEIGAELYRIGDLTHVWVMADLFETDHRRIQPGTVAAVRYQGRTFQARMTNTLPQFEPQTRTLKTRFEVENPGQALRPDMFVDVEIGVRATDSLTAPADAVIDSGRQKTVYVQRGDTSFEPRAVETGARIGDRITITKGLEPGERIVVAGNFLIDSETRMRAPKMQEFAGRMEAKAPVPARDRAVAVAAPATDQKDPVCGMEVTAGANSPSARHGGKTYHFCSDQCKKTFEADPGKYTGKQSAQRVATAGGPA